MERILIVCPKLHGLECGFRSERYDVTIFSYDEAELLKPNLLVKVISKISFGALSNFIFFNNKVGRVIEEVVLNGRYDVLIVVKGVSIYKKVIKDASVNGIKKTVLFCWDPLSRFAYVNKNMSAYDEVYVTQYNDKKDVRKFSPVPIDMGDLERFDLNKNERNCFVFVGKKTNARLSMLGGFIDSSRYSKIFLIGKNDRPVSRDEYLYFLSQSFVALDLNEFDQEQWTVRLADALCMGVCVISNSSEVDVLPIELRRYVFGISVLREDVLHPKNFPKIPLAVVRIARSFFSSDRLYEKL